MAALSGGLLEEVARLAYYASAENIIRNHSLDTSYAGSVVRREERGSPCPWLSKTVVAW